MFSVSMGGVRGQCPHWGPSADTWPHSVGQRSSASLRPPRPPVPRLLSAEDPEIPVDGTVTPLSIDLPGPPLRASGCPSGISDSASANRQPPFPLPIPRPLPWSVPWLLALPPRMWYAPHDSGWALPITAPMPPSAPVSQAALLVYACSRCGVCVPLLARATVRLCLCHVSPRHVLSSSAHPWPSVVRGVGSSTGKCLGLGKLEGEWNGTTSEWQGWDRSSPSAATSVAVLTAGHGQLDYMWAAWDPTMWAVGQSASWEGR